MVDDGSGDGTADAALAAGADQVVVLPATGARAPRCGPACSPRRGPHDRLHRRRPRLLTRPAPRGCSPRSRPAGTSSSAAAATPTPRRGRRRRRVREVGGRVINLLATGRAARPPPRHPVRAQGVPVRRRPRSSSARAASTASPSTSRCSTWSSATSSLVEVPVRLADSRPLDGAGRPATASGSLRDLCRIRRWSATGAYEVRSARRSARGETTGPGGTRPLGCAPDGRPRRDLQGLRHPGDHPRPARRRPAPRHRRRLRPLRRDAAGGADRVLVARDMRPSGVELVGGVRRGRARARASTSSTSAWPPPTSCTSPSGTLDAPGRDVHRSPQPGPVQRHQAVPRRAPGRSARTPASTRSRRLAAGRASTPVGPAGRRIERSTCSRDVRRPRPLLRRHVDALPPAQGRGRHRQRHGRPRRPRGVRRRCRSTSRSCTASSTARSRTTRPTRSSPRTCATSRPGCSRSGADVGPGLRRRRRPGVPRRRPRAAGCRARPPRRSSPPACSTRTRAPRSSTTSSARRRCPRSSASTAARRSAPGSATASSRPVMAETGAAFGGEHSAHYYFRDNCRADSGLIAALRRARAAAASAASRCRSCASRSSATPRRARSTPRSTTRRGDRARSPPRYADRRPGPARRAHRRPRRLVVQPAPVATPSRCCASTSRPRPATTCDAHVAEVRSHIR